MRKLFITLLLIALVTIQAGITGAWALGSAEIISPVNLRQGPGLDSSVISVLRQGQKVSVLDRNNNWFMVSVDKETYGFKGWVYGDFLDRLTPREPPAVPPEPAYDGKAAASSEAVTEVKNPAEAVPGKPASIAAKEKPSSVETATGVEIHKQIEASVQPERKPAAQSQASVRQKVPVQPPAAAPDIPVSLEQAENALYTAQATLRQQAVSPGQTMEAGGMAPRWSGAGRAAIEAESVNSHPFPFAGIVLKLSMVLFCCISLVFATKAYVTAKEARKSQA